MSDEAQPFGPGDMYLDGKFYFQITAPRQNDGFEESWTFVSDAPMTRKAALAAFLASQPRAMARMLTCEPPVRVTVWQAHPLDTVVGWFTLHGSVIAKIDRVEVGVEVDTMLSTRRKKRA